MILPKVTVYGHELVGTESRVQCVRCGAWAEELGISVRQRAGRWEYDALAKITPCTGNAYVCRVARKIVKDFPECVCRREGELHGVDGWETIYSPIPPWEYTPLFLFVSIRDLIGIPSTDKIRDLTKAIKTNPAVCPILADSLEEAGCSDAALLEALRTP